MTQWHNSLHRNAYNRRVDGVDREWFLAPSDDSTQCQIHNRKGTDSCQLFLEFLIGHFSRTCMESVDEKRSELEGRDDGIALVLLPGSSEVFIHCVIKSALYFNTSGEATAASFLGFPDFFK